MQEKILFVDDEPAVLQGYQRVLRPDFRMDTAVGGKGGLIVLRANGPYAVVVSDMKMPGMNGIEFLGHVKRIAPNTIRILLTGNADLETAVNAVNEGNIFRFLTKPCAKEKLAETLNASLAQFRLETTEKELVENTLKASIHLLTEVLSLVSPAAFSQASRLERYVAHLVRVLGLANPWRFELAAMMSQLGCVVLDPGTVDQVYTGKALSPMDQSHYDSHPQVARRLLENIPRMEAVAWMIAYQHRPAPVQGDIAAHEPADLRLGATLLRVAVAFDELLRQGQSRTEAAHQLARRFKNLDPKIFYALVELEPDLEKAERQTCSIDSLALGTILDQDVRTNKGVLIVAKGQEVTHPLKLKLKSFHEKGAIDDWIQVAVPRSAA